MTPMTSRGKRTAFQLLRDSQRTEDTYRKKLRYHWIRNHAASWKLQSRVTLRCPYAWIEKKSRLKSDSTLDEILVSVVTSAIKSPSS